MDEEDLEQLPEEDEQVVEEDFEEEDVYKTQVRSLARNCFRARGGTQLADRAQLDVRSQWLVTLFDPNVDVRKLADLWNVRRSVWQRFWDRLFETEVRCTCSPAAPPPSSRSDRTTPR